MLRALARRVSGWIGLFSLLLAIGAAVAAPAITAAQSTPISDHPALQRYDIRFAALPPASIIENRQYSAWELYQGPMIAAAAVMAILLILVVVLIIVTRRLNHARLALGRLNATLETQVQERTAALSQTNQNLELEITERQQAEAVLRDNRAILQAAMDQSPAGIAIADATAGSLRFVNDVGLLIRGGDRRSIVDGIGIDQYVASWQLLDPDGRPLSADEVPLARAVMFGETNSREGSQRLQRPQPWSNPWLAGEIALLRPSQPGRRPPALEISS